MRSKRTEDTVDMVDHPPHYVARNIECWDWYELIMTSEEFQGHMKGLILKYIYRIGHKWDDVEDLRKVVSYANRWIKYLEDRRPIYEEVKDGLE